MMKSAGTDWALPSAEAEVPVVVADASRAMHASDKAITRRVDAATGMLAIFNLRIV